jgi:hypothetical protein
MWKSIGWMVCGVALLTGIGAAMPAAARADDPNMGDYNTYWQVAEDPTPPNPNQDYNTYWQEVQAQQQYQQSEQ